jgi:hypothetical protein
MIFLTQKVFLQFLFYMFGRAGYGTRVLRKAIEVAKE